jgi:hypothetical protein
MELILGPNECGVDDERDLVAIRPASAGAFERGSRSPRGVEIVWRVGRLQKRVFEPHNLTRWGQDHVMRPRRTQNHVATRFAAGKIDLEARKGCAGQLEIGDAALTTCHASRSRPTAEVANAVIAIKPAAANRTHAICPTRVIASFSLVNEISTCNSLREKERRHAPRR